MGFDLKFSFYDHKRHILASFCLGSVLYVSVTKKSQVPRKVTSLIFEVSSAAVDQTPLQDLASLISYPLPTTCFLIFSVVIHMVTLIVNVFMLVKLFASSV